MRLRHFFSGNHSCIFCSFCLLSTRKLVGFVAQVTSITKYTGIRIHFHMHKNKIVRICQNSKSCCYTSVGMFQLLCIEICSRVTHTMLMCIYVCEDVQWIWKYGNKLEQHNSNLKQKRQKELWLICKKKCCQCAEFFVYSVSHFF